MSDWTSQQKFEEYWRLFPRSWPWINLLTLELASDLTTPSPGLRSHRWGLAFTVSWERASFSSLQQGQLDVTSEWTSWTFTWLYVAPLFVIPHPDQYPLSAPPLCSLTELFIQAMLGGVSCSQGHPVLQLLPSVCFSSRFQGIYLGWGYGCVYVFVVRAKTALRVYLVKRSTNSKH